MTASETPVPNLDRLCEDYCACLKHERGCSETTRITYISWLRMFTRWLREGGYGTESVESFTLPILRSYFYSLSGRKENPRRPRTIRSAWYPLRGLGDYLIQNGLLTENPAKQISLPKKDAAKRLTISDAEIVAILEASSRLYPKRRATLGRAMLYTLVFSGIRFQELVDLKVGDIGAEQGSLLVASGKGSKSRLLYPPPECMGAIAEWVAVRGECGHDWLWAEGKFRRTGEASIRDMLEEVKCIAGLEGRENIKPHSLRHAFATRMMDNGAPLKSIQAALGHSHISTTAIYTHVNEQDTKKMATFAGFVRAEPPPVPVPAPETKSRYHQERRSPHRVSSR